MPVQLAFDTGDVLDALNNFIQILIANYGRWGTIGIFVAIALASTGWRIYQYRRKDKEVNLALKEKDRTIQRLAEQERNYRILFFKEKCGWTDDEIEKFVMKNEFEDVPSARRELEGEQPPPQREGKPTRSRRKRR
jgi:hypothetical protein